MHESIYKAKLVFIRKFTNSSARKIVIYYYLDVSVLLCYNVGMTL